MIKKKPGKPSPTRPAARKSPATTKASAGAKPGAKPAKDVAKINESKPPASKTAASKTAASKPVAKSIPKPAAKPAPVAAGDPLDAFITAAVATLDLPVDAAWLPAIKANLEVTLRLGAQVLAFELPDETEPAPVFGA